MSESPSGQRAKSRRRSADQRDGGSGAADAGTPELPASGSNVARGEADGEKKASLEIAEQVVTAGRAGEQNLRIEWIDVEVNGYGCVRFNVATVAGNELDVEMQQLSYRRKYTGSSTLATDITPIVPVGSRGKLIAIDVSTGETLEMTWIWRTRSGPSFLTWLVNSVKKLLVG